MDIHMVKHAVTIRAETLCSVVEHLLISMLKVLHSALSKGWGGFGMEYLYGVIQKSKVY